MLTRTVSALLTLVLTIGLLPAQTGEWEVFRSPEKVNDYLDMGDYFWLATNNGVSRLQKDDLTSEFWSPQNSSLPSGHIQSVAKDQSGHLWIGTYDAEIAMFENGNWEPIPVPEQVKAGDDQDRLYFLEFDAQNRLWVGTHTGLHRFDGQEWTTWNQATTGEFISDVWAIAFGPGEKVYFVGFFIYELDGDQLTDLSQNDFHLVTYGGAYLQMLDGDLWFSSPSNSIARFDGATWDIFPFFQPGYWEGGTPNEISNVTLDPDGQVVANAPQGGLFQLQDTVWTVANTPQSELANMEMDQYLFDAEGDSWAFFGTQVSRQGQDGLTQGPIAELTIRHNSVRDVVEGPDGSIYALTDDRKVDRYLDGQWTPLWTPADTFQNYFYFMEMKMDDAGNLWLSTMDGLFKWDGQTWEIIHEDNSGFPFNYAYRLETGPGGQLWVSTNTEVAWFDGQTWHAYTPDNSLLTGNSLKDMVADQNGVLWVTTYERELFRLENGVWQRFTKYNSIIPDDYWSGAMTVDAQNRLWISLGYNGLLSVDGGEWAIIPKEEIPYNESEPLNAYIHSLGVDENGWFYLVKSEALTVWDGADTWVEYSAENSPVEGYTYKMLFDAQDRLWLATNTGLLSLQLETTDVKDPAADRANIARVFPNPVKDFLTVEWTLAAAAGSVLQISDAAGRTLQTHVLPEDAVQFQINVSGLPPGIYYLRVSDGRNREVIKLVK